MAAFDPLDHSVREVNAYLAGKREEGDLAEVSRVLGAELSRSDGREPRTSITGGDRPEDVDVQIEDESPVPSDEATAAGVDEDGEFEDDDEPVTEARPVWDVRTHGKPPYGREDEFRIVGR